MQPPKQIKFSELCTFEPKQWEALDASINYKYVLFGGSRGPGKSHWLRWAPIYHLMRWYAEGHRGVHVGMFCEDYPSLRDRQISHFSKFPAWLGELKSTQVNGLGFYLHECYGGGIVLLRNLKDATRYQSAEFAGIAIDELTKNPLSAFDDVRGSLRWPGIENPFFIAATNPNGRYFKWVRSAWIERDFTGGLDHLATEADQFKFVQALPGDNSHLTQDYWDMLESLPTRTREAWRDGSWYVTVEGLVFDQFTSDNITERDFDPELPYEIGIDNGYIDPRATVFIQRQGAQYIVFDELYQTKTLEEATVTDIIMKGASFYKGPALDKFNVMLADFNDKNDAPPTNRRLSAMAQASGVRLPEIAAVSHEAVGLQRRLREADIPARNWMSVRAPGGGSTRTEAITATRGLICDGRKVRTLLINKRCKFTLDEIRSGYRNKPDKTGGYLDQPLDGNDHAAEALEGWVWLRGRR